MKRAILVLAIILGSAAFLVFVGIPLHPFPHDAMSIEILPANGSAIIKSFKSSKEIDDLYESAGYIWFTPSYNSQDRRPQYRAIIHSPKGDQNILFTPSEWGDHGKTSEELLAALDLKNTAEQDAAANP